MLLGRRGCTLKRRCFRACTENMLLEVCFSDNGLVEHARQSLTTTHAVSTFQAESIKTSLGAHISHTVRPCIWGDKIHSPNIHAIVTASQTYWHAMEASSSPMSVQCSTLFALLRSGLYR